MRLPGFSAPLCLEVKNYGHKLLVHLPCLFPLRCVELFVAVAAVSVAELFAAVAAGDTVAVLLSSSLILPSAAGAGSCNVVVFCLLFPTGDSSGTETALRSGRRPHG